MSTICYIDFENSELNAFYAGQLLRGTVRLNLMEKKTVRGIYIQIKGNAFAKWRVGKEKYCAFGNQSYLDEKLYLVGGMNDEIKLERGIHNYTFKFLLPPNLPSSIEGICGRIRYSIRIVLIMPWWRKKEFKKRFTVVNRAFNLNDNLSLRQPFVVTKTKNVYPRCIDRDPITIVARTPISGYTPQQTIHFEFHVNNQSNVKVTHFTVELIQSINYSKRYIACSWTHRYDEEFSLFRTTLEGCDENQRKNVIVDIGIPGTIPPTDFLMSNLMKVKYFIRIMAITPWFYENFIFDMPITIGTFPIQKLPQNVLYSTRF